MTTVCSRLRTCAASVRTRSRALTGSSYGTQAWRSIGWPNNSHLSVWSKRPLSTAATTSDDDDDDDTSDTANQKDNMVRLSRLLAQHTQRLAISRREAERLIKGGDVTVAGKVITSPHFLLNWDDLASPGIIKVSGKGVTLNSSAEANNKTDDRKVWLVHKLRGEVVADFDPQGRPSLMERLMRSGVGKKGKHRSHIKSIGRLDMMTEGLVLVTTCGQYARDMELPSHQLHRTYRVRVHGLLTRYKVQAIQRGIRIDDSQSGKTTRYGPMKVHMEIPKGRKQSSTNSWITISCTEGKNRQIRNVLQHLGLTVTRLIRTSFGDYNLDKIPAGLAIEVPIKDIDNQKRKGPLVSKKRGPSTKAKTAQRVKEGEAAAPVQWVRPYR